ncbi:hypothetical protein Pan97_24700 [Bremerella volcania]|uniref:Uncharacterized protein n=1 Tax=Bremerella volcania TaxID=2527984 RepID=A0A518C884_9BACT|nr:hypothetical protein [Bremerella volcania]QDU75438.1 hypothetical protein Pan97_24700 [Bremerella volcania]
MTQNEIQDTNDNDLEVLYAELTAREAEIMQREKALQEKEAALLAFPAPTMPAIGLNETDLDLSTAPEEAKRGIDPQASPAQRKAYGKWLRESHPGRTPLKSFHVTLKKKNTDERTFTLAAVDESDARRQAYQQAGIAQRTEGYNALVQRA